MMNCSGTLNSNRMLYDPSLSLRVSKYWPQSNLRCREYTLTVVWLMTATLAPLQESTPIIGYNKGVGVHYRKFMKTCLSLTGLSKPFIPDVWVPSC